MALAPQKWLNEKLESLIFHIRNRMQLDEFTLRMIVSKASKVHDEPKRLTLLGLAYGAAGQHEKAVGYFQQGVKYSGETVARNYLSYLSHTGQYFLYRDESIRLAKEKISYPIFVRARNAAYADGDAELSLFFARKAMTMVGDMDKKELIECHVSKKNEMLNRFAEVVRMSTAEMKYLTRTIVGVAKKRDILAVSQEYYTGNDGDAAVIVDVICDDPDLLAEMDIEVATVLVIDEQLAGKSVTAWFRGWTMEEIMGMEDILP